MSSKPMPWIKLFPSLLHDVRLFSLTDRQKLRYFEMYMLAGQLNADGSFVQDGKELKPAEIAHLLRVNDAKQFEKDLIALKKSRLVRQNGHGPYIADFKDEQINWVELQRNNRERQARFKQSHAGNALVTDESRVDNAPRTRTKNQTKNQIQIKNQPPLPLLPSKGKGSSRVGGLGSKNRSSLLNGPDFTDLNKNQRAMFARIEQVLSLSGLGNLKLKNTLSLLTTRSTPKNKMQFVLAALASAYADKGANNKAIIATHRIEKSSVPAEYFSPATWDVIPGPILKAAGDVGLEPHTNDERIRAKVKAIRARSKA